MEQGNAGGTPGVAPQSEPQFDVVVRVPPHVNLEDIDRQARAAGITGDRVDALVKALRSGPQARIGSAIPRSRAEAARVQFTKAGLQVELTPVLGLQELTHAQADGKHRCPACETRVVLTPERQCSNCGVYVDKVTEEFLLRRRLLQQEKAKLDFQLARDAQNSEKKNRESMEAALREQIRQELEEEYGIRKRSALLSPPLLAGFATVLVAVAFLGGRGSLGEWPWQSQAVAAKGGKAGDPDKVLEGMGPKGASGAQGSAGTAAGDPDIDDPLIRQAGGERIGAKGLTVEQAVAASQVLAKSVGHNGPGIVAGPGEAGAGGAGGAAAGAAPGAAAPGVDLAAAAIAGAENGALPAPVSPALKAHLTLDMARQMAEMGEWGRARALMKVLLGSSRIVVDPAMAAAATAADVEVRAWGLRGVLPADARGAAESLMAQAQALPAGAVKAAALGSAGVILSGQPSLPSELSRDFLLRAGDAAKGIAAAPERTRAGAELTVAVGRSLLAEAEVAARSGAWARVQTVAAQAEALVGQAGDASAQARLLAIDAHLKAQLGKSDAAAQSMARSLQAVQQVPELHQRAVVLQQVAQLAPPTAAAALQSAVADLRTQAMAGSGNQRARALLELAVLQAHAGAGEQSGELATAAGATAGLTPDETVAIRAGAIVRRDLAQARLLHQSRRYLEAETVLRRVADYLM